MADDDGCLIVGGGVIGLAIARRLALDGLTVTLFDRGPCGTEASWAGAGILSPCNPHRSDAVFHLHERSLALYPRWCDDLKTESGIDPEYERCGELQLLFSDDALRCARSDVEAAAGRTTDDGSPILEIHSSALTTSLEPAVSPKVWGSLEWRQTGQVRNPRLLRALRASCERAGVDIRENTPVVDFQVGNGRVAGVTTSEGMTRGRWVVLCAGAWSSNIGDRLRTIMPVHPVRGQMVLLKTEQRVFRRIVTRGRTYLVPRRDGHVLVGSTDEPKAGFNKRTTAKGLSELMTNAMQFAPALAESTVVASWAGLRPATPDEKPYLGPVPGLKGLIAATGHYRNGLTLAPVTAEAVLAMIQARSFDIDLTCCRPWRGSWGQQSQAPRDAEAGLTQ